MARTIKKGLDYFPFDVDFFQDIRIRKLIKYQSGKAITVYALLLCTIYRNGYYAVWDKELPFIISEQSGYTEAYIHEVIDCCLNIGLLSKELFESERILTSKGIQERYRRICSSSRRNCVIKEYNLLSADQKEPDPEPESAKPQQPAKPPKAVKPQPAPTPPVAVTASAPSPVKPPAVPKLYSASVDEEVKELKKSPQWKESVCIRYNLTPEKVDFFLSDFALKCNKLHTSLQDAKSHFCYWLQEQTKKPKQQNPPPQASTDNLYEFKGGFGGKDQ